MKQNRKSVHKKLMAIALILSMCIATSCKNDTVDVVRNVTTTTDEIKTKDIEKTKKDKELDTKKTAASTTATTTDDVTSNKSESNPSNPDSKTITLKEKSTTFSGSGISVVENTVKITEGGAYTVSGVLSNGEIIIDTTDEILLTLDNMDITNSEGSALSIIGEGDVTIETTSGSENFFSDNEKKNEDENAVIQSNSKVTLSGSGTLTITTKKRDALSAGSVDITSGVINISTKWCGIYAVQSFTMQDGKLDIEKSYEGIESDSEIIINGGEINVKSSDDALNAQDNITINNGIIHTESGGDGFDSNNEMTINGGEMYIFAANKDNSALDISDKDKIGKFFINGGTVIAGGGDNRIDVEESSTQGYSWIYPPDGLKKNRMINVFSRNGGEKLFTFNVPKKFDLLFISTDGLKPDDDTLYLE